LKTRQLRIAELFSGIGAQNKALANISKELGFEYQIELTCEWDMHAILAYDMIHNDQFSVLTDLSNEELVDLLLEKGVSWNGKDPIKRATLKRVNQEVLYSVLQSIVRNKNCVNIKQMDHSNIPEDLDILTYSFPCQDLSNMGHLHGYSDGISKSKSSRSGLLWEIDRVLKDVKREKKKMPKILLMENVTSLKTKRHLRDFDQWKQSLNNLGYFSYDWVLKSREFGVPQNRERLIMVSVFQEYYYDGIFDDIEQSMYEKKTETPNKLSAYLKTDYKNKQYFYEALDVQPNLTKSRLKIWNENPKIIDTDKKTIDFIPTITTKQDRHPNSGNLYFEGNKTKAPFRYLTPRECFMLMGFDESDYDSMNKFKFKSFNGSEFLSKDIRYKLAGNSVVVPILEAVFYAIIKHVLI
jgi:DNA (cytosine-5)-methyltransferase 1